MEKWWVEAQLRDGGKCVYCGFELYSAFEAYWSTQGDHLIPQRVISDPANSELLASHDVFIGGPVRLDTVRNCVTACVFCNQHKGGWIPENWENMAREQLIEANRTRLSGMRNDHELEYHRRLRILKENAGASEIPSA